MKSNSPKIKIEIKKKKEIKKNHLLFLLVCLDALHPSQ